MNKARQANQGGSIVNFVIIGIILAASVLGAVYFINQHGDQVRDEQTVATSDSEQQQENSGAVGDGTADVSLPTNSEGQDSESSDDHSSTTLPVTGPEDQAGNLFAAFMLVTMFAAYITSRRELVRYL